MKASDSIVMIGAPESGKTNYLGRLWGALQAESGPLRATQQANDIRYVLETLSHLLQGKFPQRTEKSDGFEGRHCSVRVAWERNGKTEHAELLVPDVSGEIWEDAVETNEVPEAWMASVQQSIGALLFVRVASSVNSPSLDWVTARELLELEGAAGNEGRQEAEIPTDVQLCEFIRFLELALGKDVRGASRPRVAVLIAAWDIVDEDRAGRGPKAYLEHEFPLFAGRLADVSAIDVEVFGVTVVGGDFADDAFRAKFLAQGDIDKFGYVVTESSAVPPGDDVTTPVRWILDGKAGR